MLNKPNQTKNNLRNQLLNKLSHFRQITIKKEKEIDNV